MRVSTQCDPHPALLFCKVVDHHVFKCCNHRWFSHAQRRDAAAVANQLSRQPPHQRVTHCAEFTRNAFRPSLQQLNGSRKRKRLHTYNLIKCTVEAVPKRYTSALKLGKRVLGHCQDKKAALDPKKSLDVVEEAHGVLDRQLVKLVDTEQHLAIPFNQAFDKRRNPRENLGKTLLSSDRCVGCRG